MTYRSLKLCHNHLTGTIVSVLTRINCSQAGAGALWQGVRVALERIEQTQPWAGGIYRMPQFGRYDLAAEIVEKCR